MATGAATVGTDDIFETLRKLQERIRFLELNRNRVGNYQFLIDSTTGALVAVDQATGLLSNVSNFPLVGGYTVQINSASQIIITNPSGVTTASSFPAGTIVRYDGDLGVLRVNDFLFTLSTNGTNQLVATNVVTAVVTPLANP